MDAFSNEFLMVDEVIKSLKEGNIYKAKFTDEIQGKSIKSKIKS